MIDYRTETEKNRDKRNERICTEYVRQRKLEPNKSRNRIVNQIGESLTPKLQGQTVRKILIDNNLY